MKAKKAEEWPVIWGPDSGAIDRRICELYLQGVPLKDIQNDPGIGVGYGSVLKRIGRLRKRGLLPYRSEPSCDPEPPPPLLFLCPRCRSAFDSKIKAELCCAAEEEILDVLRRCGL